MTVIGMSSFKGGTGKSAVVSLTAHALAQAGYTVTVIDAGTNADQSSTKRVQLARVLQAVPTLDRDTFPTTWWTDPTTGFQLLPGSPYPVLRSFERITADTARALKRLRELPVPRDFVFIDLPQTQQVVEGSDALLDMLDFVIVVVNHIAVSVAETKNWLEFLTSYTVERSGPLLDQSQIRLCYTEGSPEVRDGFGYAQSVLHPWPIQGNIPYDRQIVLGGNAGDLVGRASPATFAAVRAFAREVFGVPVPDPPSKKRWRRAKPTALHTVPRSAVAAAPPANLPAADLPSSPLDAPSWGVAVSSGVGAASVATLFDPPSGSPSLDATSPLLRPVNASPMPVESLPAFARASGTDRPTVMLRVFVPRPSITPDPGWTPTANLAAFVLESSRGSRKMDTIASILANGDSKQAAKKIKTLSNVFKANAASNSIVLRSGGSLALADGVSSDYRWIAALSQLAARSGDDPLARWGALAELLDEVGQITDAAYGSSDVEFAWAFTREDSLGLSPAEEATRRLVAALVDAADAWLDLAVGKSGEQPFPGRIVVSALLRIQGLLDPASAEALLAAAGRVAVELGELELHSVRLHVVRRTQAGIDSSEELLHLIGR